MNPKPFIPSWLDDAGLTPSEMRVFVHLLRSADNTSGIAWPSYDRMVATCQMSKRTVRRAIESLAERKLIESTGKPFGGSCRYKVLPIVPLEHQLNPSNSATTDTIEPPPIVPPEYCNSATTAPPIVPPGIQEGNPKKVIQRRVSNKEEIPLPFSSDAFREAWAEWTRHRSEIRKPLMPTSTKMQFAELEAMGESRAIAAINLSITKGWTGIYEEEKRKAPSYGKAYGRPLTPAEVDPQAGEYGPIHYVNDRHRMLEDSAQQNGTRFSYAPEVQELDRYRAQVGLLPYSVSHEPKFTEEERRRRQKYIDKGEYVEPKATQFIRKL